MCAWTMMDYNTLQWTKRMATDYYKKLIKSNKKRKIQIRLKILKKN